MSNLTRKKYLRKYRVFTEHGETTISAQNKREAAELLRTRGYALCLVDEQPAGFDNFPITESYGKRRLDKVFEAKIEGVNGPEFRTVIATSKANAINSIKMHNIISIKCV